MLPDFQSDGFLPQGVHWAEWHEIEERLGGNSLRVRMLTGFRRGIEALRAAGCRTVYLDGSFVTTKADPGDFDACWDVVGVDPSGLDPVFLDFSNQRAAQKALFLGEFFPAQLPEGRSGRTFLDFFQVDKESGDSKGIVALDLTRLPK